MKSLCLAAAALFCATQAFAQGVIPAASEQQTAAAPAASEQQTAAAPAATDGGRPGGDRAGEGGGAPVHSGHRHRHVVAERGTAGSRRP